jgi:hypothetical protein
LKKFVSNGGLLFLLNGNIFYGEVKYDNNTDTIKLIKGHGIASNGKPRGRVSEKDGKTKLLNGLVVIISVALDGNLYFVTIHLELPTLKNITLQILKQKFCLIIMQQ